MLPVRLSPTILGLIVSTFGVIHTAAAKSEVETCLEAYDRGQALRDARKLGDARKELLVCARDVCPPALRKDCATWVEEVDRSLGSVVFRVVDAQDRDLTDVEISLDGHTVATRVDGWAVAVEPGRHVVRAVALGHPPSEQTVVIAQGEKNRSVVFRLSEAPRVDPPPKPPEGGRQEPSHDGVPVGVWISGGVALVAFGTFAYAGITGTSRLSKLHDECGVTRTCSKDDVDSVKTVLLVGDIAGAVGVVAVGVLTYLLVDHLSSRSAARGAATGATLVF